jgi:SAM-dependent methyltransferase
MASLKDLVQGKETDKDTLHSYIEVYEQLFEKRRDSVRNVLEIGVFYGGSLLLWKEYFQKAVILGLDVNSMYRIPLDERVKVRINNAYSHSTLQSLGKFDVIIDDGDHSLESMKFVASEYWRLLEQGGVLVIEDIHEIEWVDILRDCFPEHLRDKVKVYDLRHIKGRIDDIMLVCDLG